MKKRKIIIFNGVPPFLKQYILSGFFFILICLTQSQAVQFLSLDEWIQSLPEDPKTLIKKDENENSYFALFDNGNSEIITYFSTEKPNSKLYVPPNRGLSLAYGWDFIDQSEYDAADRSIVYEGPKWTELRQREKEIRDKFLEKKQNQTYVSINPLKKELSGGLRVEFSARYIPSSSKEEITNNWSTKIIWPLSSLLEKPINLLRNGDFSRNKSDWDTPGIVVTEGTDKFLKIKARRGDIEVTKIPFEVKNSTRTIHVNLRLRPAPDFQTFSPMVGAVYVRFLRPDETYQYWDFQVTGTNWQEFSCVFSELLGYKKFTFAIEVRPGTGFMHIDDVSIGEKNY